MGEILRFGATKKCRRPPPEEAKGGEGACKAGDRAMDWIGLEIASCMHHGRRAMQWMRYDAANADKGGYDRKAGHFPQYR